MSSPTWSPSENDRYQGISLLQALQTPSRPDHFPAVQTLEKNSNELKELLSQDPQQLDQYFNQMDQLQQYQKYSFPLTIMHIFANGGVIFDPSTNSSFQIPLELRQMSGLLMKNYFLPYFRCFPPHVRHFLQEKLLLLLGDSNPLLRSTSSLMINKMIHSHVNPSYWGELLLVIIERLDFAFRLESLSESELNLLHGCLLTITRVCEDSSYRISTALVPSQSSNNTIRIIDTLLPRLIKLLESGDQVICKKSLEIFNNLLLLFESNNDNKPHPTSPTSPSGLYVTNDYLSPLVMQITNFISSLSQLSSHPNSEIRKEVCISITTLATLQLSLLTPYLYNICEFMLVSLSDSEESVSIESCEFWQILISYSSDKNNKDLLALIEKFLPKVIENILLKLYLTDAQLTADRLNDEAENTGKKELSFQPIHHRNKKSNKKKISGQTDDDDEEDDDDDQHGNSLSELKEGEELSKKYTIRKRAGALLDYISVTYPNSLEFMNITLPLIQQMLQHQADPRVQESGLLALGALASGCLPYMNVHFQTIFPYLLQNLTNNTMEEVKATACWVVGRYCVLFPSLSYSNGEHFISKKSVGVNYFRQTIHALIALMFDKNSTVQLASCSSLCVLMQNQFFYWDEEQGMEISVIHDDLEVLLNSLSRAFDQSGVKSILLIIDIIGSLSDSLGEALVSYVMETTNDISTSSLFSCLNKMIYFFYQLADDDVKIYPILESFCSLLPLLGNSIAPFFPPLFERCLRLLKKSLAPPQHPQFDSANPHTYTEEIIFSHPEFQLKYRNLNHYQQKKSAIAILNSSLTNSTSDTQYHDDIDIGEDGDELLPKDLAICTIDVISALSEGLKDNFSLYVSNHTNKQTRLLLLHYILVAICDRRVPELRQSGLSLAGELCQKNFTLLYSEYKYFFMKLIDLCCESLSDLDHLLVYNNAVWTVGEYASSIIKLNSPNDDGHLKDWIQVLITGFVDFLGSPIDPEDSNYKLTVAITLSRLAKICTYDVVLHSEDFFNDWCTILTFQSPYSERIDAFYGILAVIEMNPDLVLNNKKGLYHLVLVCSSWIDNYIKESNGNPSLNVYELLQNRKYDELITEQVLPPQDILSRFHSIFSSIRSTNPKLWESVLNIMKKNSDIHLFLKTYNL